MPAAVSPETGKSSGNPVFRATQFRDVGVVVGEGVGGGAGQNSASPKCVQCSFHS